MKYCRMCKKEKTENEFSNNRSKKGGKNSECRECRSIIFREWRKKNVEKRKQDLRKWKEQNMDKTRIYGARTRKKYPVKRKARDKFLYAVRKGIINKQIMCELYSSHPTVPCYGPISAHHYKGYDGESWKEVQWLCRKHHSIADMEQRKALSVISSQKGK